MTRLMPWFRTCPSALSIGLGHFPSSSSHPEGPGIEMFQSYIFSVWIETASLLFFQIIRYIEKSSTIIEKTIIIFLKKQ